jgi:hypothetical protein
MRKSQEIIQYDFNSLNPNLMFITSGIHQFFWHQKYFILFTDPIGYMHYPSSEDLMPGRLPNPSSSSFESTWLLWFGILGVLRVLFWRLLWFGVLGVLFFPD